MKLTNKSYIFLLLFFFGSCVAKKSTIEYKERIVKDTIFTETIKTVFKDVKQTLYVDSPCDSTGVLKQFDKVFKTQKVNVRVYNDEGKVNVTVDIDSIIDLKVKEFKSNYKSKIETKEVEVIKYRYNFSFVLVLIISVLLNVLLLKSKFF